VPGREWAPNLITNNLQPEVYRVKNAGRHASAAVRSNFGAGRISALRRDDNGFRSSLFSLQQALQPSAGLVKL
jgi:hypothetical protein